MCKARKYFCKHAADVCVFVNEENTRSMKFCTFNKSNLMKVHDTNSINLPTSTHWNYPLFTTSFFLRFWWKIIITYSRNLVTAWIAPNDTTTLSRDVFIGHFTCVIGTKTHLFTFNVSAAWLSLMTDRPAWGRHERYFNSVQNHRKIPWSKISRVLSVENYQIVRKLRICRKFRRFYRTVQ